MAERIKPEELRIGNWIAYHNRHGDRKEFQVYAETFCDIEATQLTPEPIHISKDWLERFGFDVVTTVGGFEKWELPNGFKLLDGKHPAFMYFRPVQFVHQLQNLFFSLTGTELKLKEQTV